jgi:AhpD family alkylhydroperoxidase
MQSRMKNPVMVIPEALQSILALNATLEKCGVPRKTLNLVHLRVSQINGCSVCLDLHGRELIGTKETNERLLTVAAWRDAPYFTPAERAALALAESATRLSDRPNAVSDDEWAEATLYYDERQLAAIVLSIGVINLFNRVNATTRQVAGEWVKSAEAKEQMETHAAAH